MAVGPARSSLVQAASAAHAQLRRAIRDGAVPPGRAPATLPRINVDEQRGDQADDAVTRCRDATCCRAAAQLQAGRSVPVSLGGARGQRFEDEDFDGEVGVEVVVTHEADDLASGELLDLRSLPPASARSRVLG
jgi:hypothetical protein